jgi:phage terminase small subunit
MMSPETPAPRCGSIKQETTNLPALKNARQERFVQELMKGTHPRQAYRLAGYEGRGNYHVRLQQVPCVAQRYAELARAAAERAEVTAAEVMKELATIAFANIADYIALDAEGTPRTDLSKLTRAQAAAVVEVSANAHRVRFKLADKLEALVQLGRMLGMFRERVELTGANGGPVETREIDDFEAAKRIAFLLAKAEHAQAAAGGKA